MFLDEPGGAAWLKIRRSAVMCLLCRDVEVDARTIDQIDPEPMGLPGLQSSRVHIPDPLRAGVRPAEARIRCRRLIEQTFLDGRLFMRYAQVVDGRHDRRLERSRTDGRSVDAADADLHQDRAAVLATTVGLPGFVAPPKDLPPTTRIFSSGKIVAVCPPRG